MGDFCDAFLLIIFNSRKYVWQNRERNVRILKMDRCVRFYVRIRFVDFWRKMSIDLRETILKRRGNYD